MKISVAGQDSQDEAFISFILKSTLFSPLTLQVFNTFYLSMKISDELASYLHKMSNIHELRLIDKKPPISMLLALYLGNLSRKKETREIRH